MMIAPIDSITSPAVSLASSEKYSNTHSIASSGLAMKPSSDMVTRQTTADMLVS